MRVPRRISGSADTRWNEVKKLSWTSKLIFILACLNGCSAQLTTSLDNAPGVTGTPAIFTCAYFNGFDDLATCQTTNHANCTSTTETFPTGSVGNCFFPVAGYAACLVMPQTWDWIYTSYGNWCDSLTTGGSGEIYQQSRSVVSCSSTVCNCEQPQTLTRTCSGAGSCGAFSPNPLTVMPTPAPCQ